MTQVTWDDPRLYADLDEDGDRAARRELVRWLCDAGVPLDELVAAVRENRIGALPAELALGADAPYTLTRVAREAGVDARFLRQVLLALGRPNPRRGEKAFSDADVEEARILKSFLDAGLPRNDIVDVARVLGQGMANTAVANVALYGREVFGMGATQIRNLLLFSTVFAGVGSIGFGYATDRAGPKKTLVWVLVTWLAAIVLTTSALAPWMLFLAGPLVGAALGGTWTVSRVMLVALSPPEKLGEFFGMYSIAGRLSAIMGPAVTAVLLTIFEPFVGTAAYRISIGSLALIVALGLYFLLRVPDVRPESNVEGFAPEPVSGPVL
jgi:hypothetical protein